MPSIEGKRWLKKHKPLHIVAQTNDTIAANHGVLRQSESEISYTSEADRLICVKNILQWLAGNRDADLSIAFLG